MAFLLHLLATAAIFGGPTVYDPGPACSAQQAYPELSISGDIDQAIGTRDS